MPIQPGTRIGTYDVLEKLGEGGMGQVYRARDVTLKRDVAIKVLPDSLVSDPDRLARFQREAEALAALNHPNVAQIYGLDRSGGTPAIVMELAEGPTLADRIDSGPIRLDEAIAIARQIAGAVEAAHERGIIHRDLKPANIKVGADGTVKVLDFGLAKAMEESDQSSPGAPDSPTLTAHATRIGEVLGTATYMSPEQARGLVVDRRSDVWAFGCVLYELLTGRRAFAGADVADTLSRVLQREPDLEAVPKATPQAIRRLLARCLQKDLNKRPSHMAAATFAIDEALNLTAAGHVESVSQAPTSRSWIAAWMVTGLAVVAVAVAMLFRGDEPARLVKLQLVPPPDSVFGALAVSPDGRTVAFTARDASGGTQLWLRPLDSHAMQALPGTDGATDPFWSPDSRSIGFFAASQLKRVDIAGGAPRVICDLINARGGARGGTWSREDIILFAAEPFGPEPLYQVPASGGEPRAVELSVEGHHHWPVFLPDGRRFLYFGGLDIGQSGIYVGSLDSPDSHLVVRAATSALFAPASSATGNQHLLLFVKDQTLMAQPVEIDRLDPLGPAVPVADHVGVDLTLQRSRFSISSNGVLVYTSGAAMAQLRWFDREGSPLATVGPPGMNIDLRISPDGRSVAVQREDGVGSADIWLYGLTRPSIERFTTEDAYEAAPVWSRDGSRLFFFSTREGPWSLHEMPLSAAAREMSLVLKSASSLVPLDVSPDGRHLLYVERNVDGTYEDLLVLEASRPGSGEPRPRPFVTTGGNENFGRFSPDGRWVAYVSDVSGRNEVYVQAFNDDGSPGREGFPISTGGGIEPVWRASALFYIGPDDMLMVVDVQTSPAFTADVPRPLFKMRRTGVVGYDVDAAGERLLVSTPIDDALTAPATVVVNWLRALRLRGAN